MEYQKKLLDNTPIQPSKFKTEIESKKMVNHEECITRSSLCDYSDAYILVKGTTK